MRNRLEMVHVVGVTSDVNRIAQINPSRVPGTASENSFGNTAGQLRIFESAPKFKETGNSNGIASPVKD